jgi:hypothetical protein
MRGADLSPDVRWCTRCYEPVRELSPRPAIHVGDFVGSPIHEVGNIPRWSRWEATATTFGPIGRIVATAIVFLTLIPGLAFNGIVYPIVFPIIATVLLREIWAKAWYVPDTAQPSGGRTHADPSPAPFQPEPITNRRLLRWRLVLLGSVAFAYGNAGIKAGVVCFATIALLVWLWTNFDR